MLSATVIKLPMSPVFDPSASGHPSQTHGNTEAFDQEIDEIEKKIRELKAKKRVLLEQNESREVKIAKLQAKANEINKDIQNVSLDFQRLIAAPLSSINPRVEETEHRYYTYANGGGEFLKHGGWIPQTPPKPIPAKPKMQRGNGNSYLFPVDESTAPSDNNRSEKRGYDSRDLSQKSLKRVKRKVEEVKSKATIIGGKLKKHTKPSSVKETCTRKDDYSFFHAATLTQKTENLHLLGRSLDIATSKPATRSSTAGCSQATTRYYNNGSIVKLQKGKQTGHIRKNWKAHRCVVGRSKKSVVSLVRFYDPTLRWHRLPQVDRRTDEADSNEDKEIWCEEKRGAFHERVKSFIACMNLVQGKKYFREWRGSVVDSVVGAFLTQNVSDFLSSSAFMSLAAKYQKACNQNKSRRNKLSLKKQAVSSVVGFNKTKMKAATLTRKRKNDKEVDWDSLRNIYSKGKQGERSGYTMDSLDWEAVRQAPLTDVSKSILGRGMNNKLAGRIKDFLDRMKRDHGSIDLEWLRDVPSDEVKKYLLSIEGMGLKCVECIRLLALKQLAFPVDTNVARIVVRLGWVPIQPLHWKLQLHHLKRYPKENSIHNYLWPSLSTLDLQTLYELHCQMITCGKVFCTKNKPNCNACPLRGECKHFSSSVSSARCEGDIEDFPVKAHDKIPKIKVKDEQSVRRLKDILDRSTHVLLQEGTISTARAKGSISPTPRSRTEHQVYELPDTHHILEGLERRDPHDPCPYLLAVWTPSITDKPIDLISSFGEHTVPGTLLIPCRTAVRGTFPLNGTFFQANEVLADDRTSENPIDVPTASIQNLARRSLYCGGTISGTFRGLSAEEIERCFKEGFVCVRGFDHETGESKPLAKRFHSQLKQRYRTE